MVAGRRVTLFSTVLLIALMAMSFGAVAEITLEKGGSAQAEWWYGGQHDICDSGGFPYCEYTYGNHWSAELAGHAMDDWAYVALDTAKRMILSELTALGFTAKSDDQTPSLSLRMAVALEGPAGAQYLAKSAAIALTAACVVYDPDAPALAWTVSVWDGFDPLTYDDTVTVEVPAADFATLQGLTAGTYDVLRVMVLLLTEAQADIGTAVVDHVTIEWTEGAVAHGDIYNLEPEWPFDVTQGISTGGPYTFDDWNVNPIPDPNDPPRQYEHWCVDSTYCPHCLDVDDQNLWGLVHQSDLPNTIPAGVVPFPSSSHAIYFGSKTAGTYDVGERAIGAICSPWNEVNPGDRYVSVEFDYFREVEQYANGEYDWTYVQIAFADARGNPARDGLDIDPFATVNNGDVEDCGGLDWKTIWYKDSTFANSTAWQHAEITHYLNADHQPQSDNAYRLRIPANATRMQIRFVFNTVDGASNNYFGWIVDNIEKFHGPDIQGCTIDTTSLPQATIGQKYGTFYGGVVPSDTYVKLQPQADGARVRWELVSVTKDGERLPGLPERLALDPQGRIYGIPQQETVGTYEVTLRLICATGRPTEKTFTLIVRPAHTGGDEPGSQMVIEHFGPNPLGSNTHFAGPWVSAAQPTGAGLPTTADCDNLWHQTQHVKYILASDEIKADYGTIAFFGRNDRGIPDDAFDPNYKCNRAKGCMYNIYGADGYVVTADKTHWVGQELIIGFKSWRNVEYYTGGSFDHTWVSVRINNGQWQQVWFRDSKDPSDASWRWEEAHTGIILKMGDKVQVQFCFDSIDGYNNGQDGNAWGWGVDEVTLYAGSVGLSIINCPKVSTSVNEYYNQEVVASGGTDRDVVWTVSGGDLPPGLGLTFDDTAGETRKAYVRGTPRETGEYTFTLQAKILETNEIAERTCTIIVGRETTLLWEDFESDPTWSMTGLWRFTGNSAADVAAGAQGPADPVTAVKDINKEIQTGLLGQGNHAAYYGRTNVANYDTGALTTGMLMLTAPVIDLAAGPNGGGPVEAFRFTFDQWRSVEFFPGGNYDKTSVQVQFDGTGQWYTIWHRDTSYPSVSGWTIEQIGPFNVPEGATTMVLRFVFDSVDKWYNNYTGWLIDNIRVESAIGGQNLPQSMVDRVAPNRRPGVLQVMNLPNPVTDVNTTTFMIRNAEVDAMRIEIFDLAGNLVFNEEVAGNELVWHTDNDFGEFLANGIYLYHAYARIQGEWVKTAVQKLVILR